MANTLGLCAIGKKSGVACEGCICGSRRATFKQDLTRVTSRGIITGESLKFIMLTGSNLTPGEFKRDNIEDLLGKLPEKKELDNGLMAAKAYIMSLKLGIKLFFPYRTWQGDVKYTQFTLCGRNDNSPPEIDGDNLEHLYNSGSLVVKLSIGIPGEFDKILIIEREL